jgi:cadmium resistance protein CadD (predicted permease)
MLNTTPPDSEVGPIMGRVADPEKAKDNLVILMTLYWHILDTHDRPTRIATYLFFFIGTALVLVPSLLTMLQVTLVTFEYWFGSRP